MPRSGILIFSSAIVLTVALAACDSAIGPSVVDPVVPLPALDVPWTPNQSIVCFGTSLTYGFILNQAAGPPSIDFSSNAEVPQFNHAQTIARKAEIIHSYPYQLGLTLNIAVHNQGLVGARTDQALAVIRDSVLNKNPALVLLEFPANDLLQNVDVFIAEQYLNQIIDTLQRSGSKVILISFLFPEMINSIPPNHYLAGRKDDGQAYLDMLKRIASERSIPFVEYAMFGIYWDQSMMSDPIHPNQAGYKKMQENISKALSNTFAHNGMLK